MGYSPWGLKELDMTEKTHTHTLSLAAIHLILGMMMLLAGFDWTLHPICAPRVVVIWVQQLPINF